jgi:clan AA aspartic protease (TIGR02281 family)
MLQYQDNWKLLAELDSLARVSKDNDSSDKAGVESWAMAFRQVAPRQIKFADAQTVLPLSLSVSGVPMIDVTINGKRHTFWLDTGASMSIVSSNVASELGIRALTRDTLEVATTTGRVPAQPSQIERLQLGTIEVRNTPALIVASERMLIRLGDEAGVPVVTEIEGVVGFDLISRFDLRIDYANARVILAKPATNVRLPATGRNLFWIGTPIVRLVTSKGIPLHFNLDTGAQETYSTDGLPIKTKARTFSGERRLIGGLAGVTSAHGRFVDELRANMGGQAMVLRKLMIFIPQVSSFVALDGILGSDIGKGGVVRIDATNGLFVIEAARWGLR